MPGVVAVKKVSRWHQLQQMTQDVAVLQLAVASGNEAVKQAALDRTRVLQHELQALPAHKGMAQH